MNLNNTEKLLNQKFADNDFDSYCVFVYAKGYERFIHSPNVNADTYFDIASMGKVLVTSPLILKLSAKINSHSMIRRHIFLIILPKIRLL